MPITFEESQAVIARLVKHFLTNRDTYRAPAYKEAHARQEFIDPLFAALGWDVANAQQAAPDYREVVVEDTVEIAGQKKAPDYVFRVGRERKFFVEAKKPGVDLKQDAGPAYQLRRYAWTAKLPLSLLTDFEELAIYDCRARPTDKDKASAGRLYYFTCETYGDHWREIWDLFSREAVWGGAFDKFATASGGKRGSSTVDVEFLKEIEGWRETLARNIALRNERLSVDEVNDAVQRTIDRLIFLRMAEDRGIEDYGRLQHQAEGDDIYRGLIRTFRHADARYNSGLFDFSRAGDTLTPGLAIDDKVLRPIITSLYFPQSPYEFSVLPVEILGNIYEQFLGKVIRLTSGHQAKVEEKPEVKKAGGVHYTPTYIAEYIVRNTVGVAVAGRTPPQLRGFRTLDPACGSGSILLCAYQYLLDYYLSWYITNTPEKHPKAVWKLGEVWRLTTAERKRILTEHIFGVDIDRQAVEVTKLSLLLKVLETESDESLGKQLALLPAEAKERVLPNLDHNIKCGNSLIGPDYFTGQLLPDADELRRVNPFDWAREFPQVMKPASRALWFVTFVTHNSRISERMVTYGVQTGEPLVFSPDDQMLIAETIFETCQKEGLAVVAANVLPDHVHLVLAAEDEKILEEHIRKIKGASSYTFQRARGWEKGSNQHVWAQKFNRVPISDSVALANILDDVNNNHLKHVERWGEALLTTWDKGLKPLVRARCVSVEEACQPHGGFDCVIGNPPYVDIKSLPPQDVRHIFSVYPSANNRVNLFAAFIEKSFLIVKSNSFRFSMIIPTALLTQESYQALRKKILKEYQIKNIVRLPNESFGSSAGEVKVDTVIVVLGEQGASLELTEIASYMGYDRISRIEPTTAQVHEFVQQSAWAVSDECVWSITTSATHDAVLTKCEQNTLPLEECAEFCLGLTPYDKYKGHTPAQIKNQVFHATTKKDKTFRKLLAGNDVKRYSVQWNGEQWISYGPWLGAPREKRFFTEKRIVVKQIIDWTSKRIWASIIDEELYNTQNAFNLLAREGWRLEYLLGVLNSRLMTFYHQKKFLDEFKMRFQKILIKDCRRFPIHPINFSDPADKARHDQMVTLVEQMLDLHKRLTATTEAGEQSRLQRLIDSTDGQIDALVYELYGLTAEEVAVVSNG